MSNTTTTPTTEAATARHTARAALDQYRTARQDAAERGRTRTAERAALSARRDALHLDARLGLAGAADELADVEGRLAVTVAEIEDDRRLEAEAARREPAAIAALHTAAFDAAVLMLAELDAEKAALVARCRTERERAPADVCERVVLVARQAAGLAHDLHGATNDPRFARRWDLREQLGPEAAALIPQLVASPFTPKPAIPRPWSALLDDLAEAVRP